MELFARRRYYFCSYCATFEFIAGEPIEGVRVLADITPPVPCPACDQPLSDALLDDGYKVLHCRHCRGVLLDRPVFSEAVELRRASATGAPKTPPLLDRRELERVVTCPQCRHRMDVHPYYGPGNVVIDTCSRCDLVWLDTGELGQITDAPGADRRR